MALSSLMERWHPASAAIFQWALLLLFPILENGDCETIVRTYVRTYVLIPIYWGGPCFSQFPPHHATKTTSNNGDSLTRHTALLCLCYWHTFSAHKPLPAPSSSKPCPSIQPTLSTRPQQRPRKRCRVESESAVSKGRERNNPIHQLTESLAATGKLMFSMSS